MRAYARRDLLTAEEDNWDQRGCVCGAKAARFESMAASADGWEMEFVADATSRRIRFFLPTGTPAPDDFAARLPAYLRQTRDGFERDAKAVEKLLPDLDADDPDAREAAMRAIVEKGSAAIRPLEGSKSPYAKKLLERLAPWKSIEDAAVRRDLALLEALRSHPKDDVKAAAKERLEKILPEGVKDRSKLVWDDDRDAYRIP
jgi:hypothetical protein